jgi:hypothetical protein
MGRPLSFLFKSTWCQETMIEISGDLLSIGEVACNRGKAASAIR